MHQDLIMNVTMFELILNLENERKFPGWITSHYASPKIWRHCNHLVPTNCWPLICFRMLFAPNQAWTLSCMFFKVNGPKPHLLYKQISAQVVCQRGGLLSQAEHRGVFASNIVVKRGGERRMKTGRCSAPVTMCWYPFNLEKHISLLIKYNKPPW